MGDSLSKRDNIVCPSASVMRAQYVCCARAAMTVTSSKSKVAVRLMILLFHQFLAILYVNPVTGIFHVATREVVGGFAV